MFKMIVYTGEIIQASGLQRWQRFSLAYSSVKPFLTSAQRPQKHYSITLRAGRCKSQHNSLHTESHIRLFLVN